MSTTEIQVRRFSVVSSRPFEEIVSRGLSYDWAEDGAETLQDPSPSHGTQQVRPIVRPDTCCGIGLARTPVASGQKRLQDSRGTGHHQPGR